jgi:hypothetical protein
MGSRTACILLATAVALGACSKKDQKTDCDRLTDSLRSCGLVSDGFFQCGDLDYDQHTRCDTVCYLSDSCEELEGALCSGVNSDCLQACQDSYGFTCLDGSWILHGSWVCDGEPDCDDASDEDGCPMHECADGSGTIRQNEVCDCFLDCDDGADEDGCPPCPTFDCADGSGWILYLWICDGDLDCPDGSDEVDCAELTCP